MIRQVFDDIFDPGLEYRATGVCLYKLAVPGNMQLDLFGETLRIEKFKKIFESVDVIRKRYGKHAVCLGSSYLANKFAAHLDERGDLPERSKQLLPGETERKRWASPCF